jgi:hypothetical protein
MWRSYIRFVFVKSVKNAWLTVIARDVPDLIGKFLLGGLVLGLLYWASDSPQGYEAFSSELNTALTVFKAGLVGASVIFFFNMLFVAPYQIWKNLEEKRELLENTNREFGEAFAERADQSLPREIVHRFEPNVFGKALRHAGDASQSLLSSRRNERARQEVITKAELERENQIALNKRRSAMIEAGRDIVHRYRGEQMKETFEAFVTRERTYLDIKPHLGNDYWKGVFSRVELKGVQDETPRSDYEAAMFEREIARLQKEWNL